MFYTSKRTKLHIVCLLLWQALRCDHPWQKLRYLHLAASHSIKCTATTGMPKPCCQLAMYTLYYQGQQCSFVYMLFVVCVLEGWKLFSKAQKWTLFYLTKGKGHNQQSTWSFTSYKVSCVIVSNVKKVAIGTENTDVHLPFWYHLIYKWKRVFFVNFCNGVSIPEWMK